MCSFRFSLKEPKSFRGFAFETAPLSPLGEHLIFSFFLTFTYIYFFITVFTNISFLSLFHLYFPFQLKGNEKGNGFIDIVWLLQQLLWILDHYAVHKLLISVHIYIIN